MPLRLCGEVLIFNVLESITFNMKLTLESLQTLDAIDRLGSFAAAASALDKVPSAVTYIIRKLEEDLDVLLYDRRGHRAKLTDAGQELLDQGRHLLNAADALERRVKRAATGCEVELRIVLDGIIPFNHLLPLIAEFEAQNYGTRLRFTQEILSGVWEALISDRADLAIGAINDGAEVLRVHGDYRAFEMGSVDWVFAVAPTHPLAQAAEPIKPDEVQRHRAIAVGDTGRTLPSITAGLLSGQDTLTVPNLQAKLDAQLAGLGCGQLPRFMAQTYLNSGQLIEKQLEGMQNKGVKLVAWRNTSKGKAISWFLKRLADRSVQQQLLGQV
jgi:DNA-binding transcriptional LysR family regulator